MGLTIGQLSRRYSAPAWLIRFIVDRLGTVPRIGQYRIVPPSMLPQIETELRRRGYLEEKGGRRAARA